MFIVFSVMQKNFSLMQSTCLFLLLYPVLLWSFSRNHCQGPCQEVFLICFLLGVLQFQVLHLSFYIYFDLFFLCIVYDKGRVSLFCMWILASPKLFAGKAILSPWCVLGTFVKDQLTLHVVYIWTLFGFTVLCICLYASTTSYQISWICYIFLKSGSVVLPASLIYIVIALAIQGLSEFNMNFRIFVSICIKI